MAEQPDRQRIRLTRAGQVRLLADLEALPPAHLVDAGTLGEYAEVLLSRGQAAADALMPELAEHLEAGCGRCDADLDELVAHLEEQDDPPPQAHETAAPPAAWTPPDDRIPLASWAARPDVREFAASRGMATGDEHSSDGGDDSRAWDALGPMPPADGTPAQVPPPQAPPLQAPPPRRSVQRPATPADSGVFAADLPDPRVVEAEAARRQRLRRLRDLLLIAAAVSVLLLGLSLVGLAYVARQTQEPVRVPLVPQPGTAPVQQAAPSGQPQAAPGSAPAQPSAGGARAVPDGMNCPPSHPVKGNRESMIYHQPSGLSYAATRPEVCFAAPDDAEAEGYRRSQR